MTINRVSKSVLAFASLLASSASLLAICPEYPKLKLAAATAQATVRENKDNVEFYTRMVSGNNLDAYAKREALLSLQIYNEALQEAELKLEVAQKKVQSCIKA